MKLKNNKKKAKNNTEENKAQPCWAGFVQKSKSRGPKKDRLLQMYKFYKIVVNLGYKNKNIKNNQRGSYIENHMRNINKFSEWMV